MKRRSGKTAAKKRPGALGRQPEYRGGQRHAVFLVGFMGAGKTSVGRALARRLNWVFEDLDDRIVRREGRTVAEIFRNSGEREFRRAEHSALRQVLEELHAGARVVALGGGAFVQKDNAALLKASKMPTVFLNAPVEELWQRCSKQAAETGSERPLLGKPDRFRDLFRLRRRSYSKASIRIETGDRTVDSIAAEITQTLGLKEIPIRTEEGEVE